MRGIEELGQLVRERGGKLTSQRIIIWQALQGDHSHPTAEELFCRLKPLLPGLSLTTLYKALNELVEWGEIRRFDSGDGHIHFDPDMSLHAELVCLRCHTVVDMEPNQPQVELPAEIDGFRIITRLLQFQGICPDCRAETQHHSEKSKEI